jgi:hypothetical protein
MIPMTSSARDLGIIVDSKLNVNEHISATVKKAYRVCNLILRCFRSRNLNLLIRAFKVYIRPYWNMVQWYGHLPTLVI